MKQSTLIGFGAYPVIHSFVFSINPFYRHLQYILELKVITSFTCRSTSLQIGIAYTPVNFFTNMHRLYACKFFFLSTVT